MSRRSRWIALVSTVVGILVVSGVNAAAPAQSATQNIVVHFTNNSDSALTLSSVNLDGGCWTNNESPPQTIAIDQSVDIASESCGVLTGTEFHVSYKLDLTGQTMSMHYDNPEVGSDTLDNTAPQGYQFGSFGVIEDHTTTFGCNSTTCDGIPDDWKKNGVTIDPGGGNPSQFVDLPKMGVSLDRPNVLVQMDWMEDTTHKQQLSQAAIDAVIKAFDLDPVTYHGATRSGITLIVDNGPDSTKTPGGATWGALSRAQKIPWTQGFLSGTKPNYNTANYNTLLKQNFVPTGRLPIFHYVVAAAELVPGDSTSGLTPPTGFGFMTSLYDWDGNVGSQNQQTGTFMHELGHTLILDYSRDNNMPNVDETTLTEANGISLGANPSNYGTGWVCPDGSYRIQQPLKPVDFNCDGKPDGGTGFDVNNDGTNGTLNGPAKSDWSRIVFKRGGVGAGADASNTVTIPSGDQIVTHSDQTFEQSQLVRVLPLDAKLTYTGATSGHYHDPATVSATLVDPGDPVHPNSPLAGRTIFFQIGSSATDVCSATTDAAGTASCSISPTQVPAAYTVKASFAGDLEYKASSDSSQTFTVTKEETSLSLDLTGTTAILAGSGGATLKAQLVEDGTNDNDNDTGSAAPNPAGQTVTFTLGSQSCQGTTDSSGVASCSLDSVSGSALGPKTLTASFSGDSYYTGSSASGNVIVFAFPSRGAFVLGDNTVREASASTVVNWWSDSWWQLNNLSGGVAPLSFKGFAGTVTLPTKTPANVCGTKFVTGSGNSPPPTSGVPSYMGVLVASSVTKAGTNINGVWAKIVVVKVNPGYSPSPGHPGTGTIVATFCG